MIVNEETHLAHYGILRRSGRYPWGSGGTENVRNRSFLDIIENHRKEGMTESQIAKGYGLTTTQLRATRSIALAQQKQQKQLTAQRLKDRGWSNVKIGERMKINESSVRALLAPGEEDKTKALQTTAKMLKEHVDKKSMLDVSVGVERQIGVTRTRLDTAIAVLKEEGYKVHIIKDKQLSTGNFTTSKILTKPDITLSHVQKNRSDIQLISDYSEDHGRSYFAPQPPLNVSSRRVGINYKEDGGDKADGVIYVRPGVKDLGMKASRYAQVRIAVDGTHYIKGMAIYKEGLPAGKDLVFNTNKSNTTSKKEVLKELDSNPEFPFGAVVRQIHDDKGRVSSAINIVNEEGDWDKYARNLSSQVLSKQNPKLAKEQLDLTHERRLREFDEINSLTNPTVRKDLLLKFADSTDSAAVHLKAASIRRQSIKVILPIPSLKENEAYAPSLRNGERVALVRFPHGGTFEIPELTVNNRNREGRKLLGTAASDAIGIHHEVAKRLSGADFDGDFVIAIPNNKGSIERTNALEKLKDFDPQSYKLPKDSPIPRITSSRKQREMGRVSNLITDMTIHGANTEELSRAIKHSMVVIDSEKHELDFKQSEKDHGIAGLKQKYQGGKSAGAKTLISRAGAETHIPQRKLRSAARGGPIDPATGKKVFEPTGFQVRDRKTGNLVPKTEKHDRLAVTENAHDLIDSPGTKIETIYADHSNRLKALANTARKEAIHIKPAPYSPSAKAVYSHEVASLNSKLNLALKNAPLERQAQRLAAARVSQLRQAEPNMEPEDVKKIKQQSLTIARIRTGAHKDKISVTQEEWNAIQAGAISTDKLEKILHNSNTDTIKELALPKHALKMTSTMKLRAKAMLDSGYTQAEVADSLGVGLTTLKVSLHE